MTLTNPSLTAFKHWLDVYTNPLEIDEIGMTNGTWKELKKQINTDDTDDVVDALVLRPFAAIFYGYWDDQTKDVRIKVLHHVNKNTVPSIRFDNRYHQAYGISGLLEDRTVVEFSSALFSHADDPAPAVLQGTPSLYDFKEARGDPAKIDALIISVPSQAEVDAIVHLFEEVAVCGLEFPPMPTPIQVSFMGSIVFA